MVSRSPNAEIAPARQLVGTLGAVCGGKAGKFPTGAGTTVPGADPDGPSNNDRAAPPVPRLINAKVNEIPKNKVAKIAVIRVNKLAVPRPDMKLPMPCDVPIPNPPPSLR